MDKLELLKLGVGFIEKIVASIAWPAVVLAIAVMFKEKLTKLLEEVIEWKGLGVEAKFARGVKEALRQAEAVTEPVAEPAPEPPAVIPPPVANDVPKPEHESAPFEVPDWSSKHRQGRVNMLLVKANPGAAIQMAWEDVKQELLNVVSAKGVYVKPELTGDVNAWINGIDKVGLLSFDQLGLLLRLRDLRNEVVQTKVSPTSATAQDYIDASVKLCIALRKISETA